MLTGADARSEATQAVEQLVGDPTAAELRFAAPDGGRVLVIGTPETTGDAIAGRPDLVVLLVGRPGLDPAYGSGPDDEGCEIVYVPDTGLSAAVTDSDLVILESECIGPEAALAASGSRAAAAMAREADVPVWLVGGVGRQLPSRMWDGVIERVDRVDGGEQSDREIESVSLRLVDRVVTPVGLRTPAEAVRRVDCPLAPELFASG